MSNSQIPKRLDVFLLRLIIGLILATTISAIGLGTTVSRLWMDNTVNVQSSTMRNLAGETTSSTNALNRQTLYNSVLNPATGHTPAGRPRSRTALRLLRKRRGMVSL